MKLTKKSDIVRSVIGIFLIIGGIGGLTLSMVLSAIIMILLGISLMPIFYEKTGLKNMKKLQIIIPILFAIILMFSIQGESTSGDIAQANSDNVQQATVSTNATSSNIEHKNENIENDINEKTENVNEENKEKIANTNNIDTVTNIQENNNSKNQTNRKSESTTIASDKKNVSTNTSSSKAGSNNSSSKKESSSAVTSKNNATGTVNNTKTDSQTVYVTPTGKRYHLISTCGGKNSRAVSLSQAKSMGLTPCKKCAQ